MTILKPSREKRLPGDVFTFRIPAIGWLFGRIIRTDANVMNTPTAVLIYVYKYVVKDPSDIPELRKEDLLLPPLFVNAKPWTIGYFKRIRREPVKSDDIWSPHCFYSPSSNKYFDEYFHEIARSEPCGDRSLGNHITFDDDVSQALGIPLASDDPVDSSSPYESITVSLPFTRESADSVLVHEFEADLVRAVKKAQAGTLEGHGFDLRSGTFDARFYGPSAHVMLQAMRPVLTKWQVGLQANISILIRRSGKEVEHLTL
ncbi:MAG: hypothetical protein KF869_15145 [Phycisphaeraceae bacterium]|nr:hypothetical protein [Phycisphaeraceae bacterium]